MRVERDIRRGKGLGPRPQLDPAPGLGSLSGFLSGIVRTMQNHVDAALTHQPGYRDRIVHVHMKDGKGRYPDFSFPPLGEGTIDFAALVAGLRQGGYVGALSVEYEAQVYGWRESGDEILGNGLAFLRRLEIGAGA